MKLKHTLTITTLATLLIILYHVNSNKSSDDVENYEEPLFNTTNLAKSNKIFNLDLKYIQNSSTCAQNESFLAIIVITSYFGHVELRSAIRRAFSEKTLAHMGLKRVFLLGEAPSDKYTKQESIVNENRRFNDIIQGNFIEAYRNLTYKHLMGLKWATDHCKAQFLIKMDDDIVVNLRAVVDILKNTKFPQKLLAGYIFKGMKPIRLKANKWYVTEEEYKYNNYPAFISGWFYITNIKTGQHLVLLSNYYKYFWIDDLFVTGIVANSLKIRHYDLSKYFTVNPEFLECCIRDVKKKLSCDIMVGPNGGDNNLFFKFNEALSFCYDNNCKNRIKSLNDTCISEYKVNLGRGEGVIQNYKIK
ncbi:unnamed protein product [Brassicogethes aeneus]|uniref:Hexosyltransferase n=1 Tax=Brassicogethes aeneus TaxID=1431903 RepID=A0A9P0BEI9_BRAAE|nr:unnamed protein product [Brassicogethes aeneus]